MEEFSQSLKFDKKLAYVDVKGSIAHARMLARQGIIGKAESNKIIKGLAVIKDEIEKGTFPYREELEDIHMNIESRLVELVGDVGLKLHTGRSRNDQVALDLRLWVKDEIEIVKELTKKLIKAILEQADRYVDLVMPGYTHLQRAQPVTAAHHLMAYAEMFDRDYSRFCEAQKRANIMPLGAGALAGSTLPLSPESVAKELGFDSVCANSMDAVSDRDFVLDFIYCCAVCQVHLSRLAEELVFWSGEEFGYVDFPEEFSTGSSLMPQKKNPDSAELIRGKTGRVVGSLMALFTIMKGLPLTYNRDLQEDKEALFDAADTVEWCLKVMREVVRRIKFDKERCNQALTGGFIMATDMAEYLVRKGVPFRSAHEIVGKLVRFALDKGIVLSQLKLEDFKQFSDCFDSDVYSCLDPMRSIMLRSAQGGPAPSRVKTRIRNLKKKYFGNGKTS